MVFETDQPQQPEKTTGDGNPAPYIQPPTPAPRASIPPENNYYPVTYEGNELNQLAPNAPGHYPYEYYPVSPLEANYNATPSFSKTPPSASERKALEVPDDARIWPKGIAGAGALILFFMIVSMVLGDISGFLNYAVQDLPFLSLGMVASLGNRRVWARTLSFVTLLGVAALFYLYNTYMVIFASMDQTWLKNMSKGMNNTSAGFQLAPGGMNQILIYFLISFLIVPVAILPFIPWVRGKLAQIIPLNRASTIEMIGLSIIIVMALGAFAQLIALKGHPALLTLTQAGFMDSAAAPTPEQCGSVSSYTQNFSKCTNAYLDTLWGLVWNLITVFFIAGLWTRRNLAMTLKRLGLVRPSLIQIGIGLGAGAVMIFASNYIDQGISSIWTYMGWYTTDQTIFNQLLGVTNSLPGAVFIGLTAGIGEETAVRGLLQPRLGIILANVAFASAHAVQYGADALISVFIIGLILGIIRRYTNTSTSAISHGFYDFLAVALPKLGF